MTAITTSVFKNNQSQAVRIPKLVELDESVKKVVVTAIGKTRIITPLENTWDDWFANGGVSDGFMDDHTQEPDTIRKSL